MYLKITYEQKTKKVLFKEEFNKISPFRQFLSDLSNIQKEELKITFRDEEVMDYEIQDQSDLDFFLKHSKTEKFACLKLEKKKTFEFPDTNFEEMNTVNHSDAFFNNVTNDISVFFPAEPFTVDQSNIDLLHFEKNDKIKLEETPFTFEVQNNGDQMFKIEDNPLIFEPKDNESEKSSDDEKPKSQKSKNSHSLIKDDKSQLTKPKEEKIISKPITILKKPGNQANILSDSNIVKFEESGFGISVLDRLCALEQKTDFINSSIIQSSKIGLNNKDEVDQINNQPKLSADLMNQGSTKHFHISCNTCKIMPIIGKRYKCLVCPNFDMCQKCEALNPHSHPMVRCLDPTDSDELDLLVKKFTKICNKKPKIFSSITRHLGDMFKKRDVHDLREDQTNLQEEKIKMLEFIDGDKKLNHEEMLKTYKNLKLEEFCEKVSIAIRNQNIV